jgi:hypothetical protein
VLAVLAAAQSRPRNLGKHYGAQSSHSLHRRCIQRNRSAPPSNQAATLCYNSHSQVLARACPDDRAWPVPAPAHEKCTAPVVRAPPVAASMPHIQSDVHAEMRCSVANNQCSISTFLCPNSSCILRCSAAD